MPEGPKSSNSPGGRPHQVTLHTIAEKAGVHKSTVSLALRNHPRIPAQTCQRIKQLANELGYRPNPYVMAVMSHMRAGRKPAFQGTIGFIHTYTVQDDLRNKFYTRFYVRGARKRADQLGFKLVEFDLQDKKHTPRQLRRMLLARNILILIIYHHPTTGIPGHQLPMDLDAFSVVSIGTRLENPDFNYVASDAFHSSTLAVTRAIELGYRRIGMAISGYVDFETGYRYSGGYYSALETYGIRPEIPVCFIESEDFNEIKPWMKKHKPEIILGLNDEVPQAASELGWDIPSDIGWIHLDWGPGLNEWAAIDSCHEAIGESAVDVAVAQFNRNDRGPPAIPKSSLVAGQWMEGSSVMRQKGKRPLQPRYKPLKPSTVHPGQRVALS